MARYRLPNPWTNDPLASYDELRRGMEELFERVGARTTRRAATASWSSTFPRASGTARARSR
jgi:hypothetical protein